MSFVSRPHSGPHSVTMRSENLIVVTMRYFTMGVLLIMRHILKRVHLRQNRQPV